MPFDKNTSTIHLFYSDSAGPVKRFCLGVSKYVSTLIDEYGRLSMVCFLKMKNQEDEAVESIIT